MNITKTLLLAFCILVTGVHTIHSEPIDPASFRERMELRLHGTPYTYYSFSEAEPLRLDVRGPARMTLIIRFLLSPHDPAPETYHVSILRDNESTDVYIVSALPSTKAAFADAPDVRPSRPEKIVLNIPQGLHTYALSLEKPEGARAAANVSLTRPWDWRLNFTLTTMYDDNIYRYSPGDIDAFVHHQADYRYRMETYDDLVSSPALTLYINRHFSQQLKSRLRLKFSYNLFAVNDDKNYMTISAHLRTTVRDRSFLQIGYVYLPEFLIRPYWDQDIFSVTSGDPATYTTCDFTRSLYSVKAGYRMLRTLRGAVYYERDILYYNSHFTEYDTKANSIGLEMLYDCTPWLQTGIEYAFKRAKAKGYDENGETRRSSDDSDISYDEDLFGGTLGVDLSRHVELPLGVTFRYRLAKRYFTTDKTLEQDPFHSGRVDTIHRFFITTEYDLLRSLSLYGAYEFHKRAVSSLEKERITEIKNYDRHRVSLGVELAYQ